MSAAEWRAAFRYRVVFDKRCLLQKEVALRYILEARVEQTYARLGFFPAGRIKIDRLNSDKQRIILPPGRPSPHRPRYDFSDIAVCKMREGQDLDLAFNFPLRSKTKTRRTPSTLRSGDRKRKHGLVLNPTATFSLSNQTTKRYPKIWLEHLVSAPGWKKSSGNPCALSRIRTLAAGPTSVCCDAACMCVL